MEYVLFFEEEVDCGICGKATYAAVEANSGTINCTECDGIIFDARDCHGTVVILELDSETQH
jgi:hypothetical protein